MIDGFFRLRHDSVVGSHHQHHNVRDLRAAGAHARERFVARRIDEHHATIVHLHFVRADVLRDAARLARRHVFAANRVQQAGLAVVHVSHHRHHRRTRLQTLFGLFLRNLQHHLLFEGDHVNHAAERFRQRRRRWHI